MQDAIAIRISLLGLLASLIFSCIVFPRIAESQRAASDPDRFGELALSIAHGNGFAYEKDGVAVLERTPLYSYVVAVLFKIAGGYSLTAVQVFQGIVHALTSCLVYLIGLRLFSRRAAMIAQTLYAFHPIALWYAARIWVETTHALLLVLVVLSLLILFETHSWRRTIVVGLLIGACCLTKSVLLFFPLIIAFPLIRKSGGRGLRVSVAIVISTCIVVLPWSVRNYCVSGHVLPVNTSLGFNLVQGNAIGEGWPSSEKGIMEYWQDGKEQADSILAPSGATWESVEGDRILTRSTVGRLLESPGFAGRRFVANFCSFWYLSESDWKSIIVGTLQISLALAALLSYTMMDTKTRTLYLPVVCLVLYYVAVNVSIVGWGRYSMPMIPFLVIAAAPLCERIFFQRTSQ